MDREQCIHYCIPNSDEYGEGIFVNERMNEKKKGKSSARRAI